MKLRCVCGDPIEEHFLGRRACAACKERFREQGTRFMCQAFNLPVPQHEKLAAVKDRSDLLSDFLDWLTGEAHIQLAQRHIHNLQCVDPQAGDPAPVCGYVNGQLVAVPDGPAEILAQYFKIDLDALNREKQLLVEVLRAQDELARI